LNLRLPCPVPVAGQGGKKPDPKKHRTVHRYRTGGSARRRTGRTANCWKIDLIFGLRQNRIEILSFKVPMELFKPSCSPGWRVPMVAEPPAKFDWRNPNVYFDKDAPPSQPPAERALTGRMASIANTVCLQTKRTSPCTSTRRMIKLWGLCPTSGLSEWLATGGFHTPQKLQHGGPWCSPSKSIGKCM
jgi:hypothetical protein